MGLCSFFSCDHPVFQHHLLKMMSLLCYISCHLYQILDGYSYMDSHWTLLFHFTVFISVPYCSYYYSSVIILKSTMEIISALLFLLRNCFTIGSFVVPYKFQHGFCTSVKNVVGIFIGIALTLQIDFYRTLIFILFTIPVCEYERSLHGTY